MATMTGDKRKNDERRIPWWLILLVGFGLGIVFTLGMSMGRGGTTTVYSSETSAENYAAQATLFVAEATLNAQAAQNQLARGELDPLLATATAIISQATQQSSQPPGSS